MRSRSDWGRRTLTGRWWERRTGPWWRQTGLLWGAAGSGHIEVVKLCKEWGATDFDRAMVRAVESGHIEIFKLCKEWGRL